MKDGTLGICPSSREHIFDLVYSYDVLICGVRQYCGVGCYSEAYKHGRRVRMTNICEYPICSLCEARTREGLVQYVPSNGTEFEIFSARCKRCRHYSAHPDGYGTCTWGILDRIAGAAWEPSDSLKLWHDPENLDAKTCPATCKKFTHKNDFGGEFRDPPAPDAVGQLTFEDLLEVEEPASLRVREFPNMKG